MRNFIIFIILGLCTMTASAQQANALMLTFKNGSSQTMMLNLNPKMKIVDGLLEISTGSVAHSFPLTDLKEYSFVTEISGINEISDITANEANYIREGDMIILGNGETKIHYALTAMSGIVLDSGEGMWCSVNLSDYMPGVYLLTVNGVTSKIVKQ